MRVHANMAKIDFKIEITKAANLGNGNSGTSSCFRPAIGQAALLGRGRTIYCYRSDVECPNRVDAVEKDLDSIIVSVDAALICAARRWARRLDGRHHHRLRDLSGPLRWWPEDSERERLEVLHDGGEMELVTSAGKTRSRIRSNPWWVFRCANRISTRFLSSRRSGERPCLHLSPCDIQKLAEGSWIDAHENLILCGATGVGKSWLASALGHKACRDNRSVLYHRVPKLFADLALARGDGRYARIQRSLGGVQLLILDDWGLEPLDAAARPDLLKILEERYGRRSTVITSQIPVDKWHELIGDPIYADAILDRTSTTPTGSISLATACDARTPSSHPRIDRLLPPMQKIVSQRGTGPRATSCRNTGRHHVGTGGRHHLGIPGGFK